MRSLKPRSMAICLVLLLVALVGCDTVGGSSDANQPPTSEITHPTEPSGTVTVADGDSIIFRWRAVDPEEWSRCTGGVAAIEIRLGTEPPIVFDCPPDTGEWWFCSSADTAGGHHISSTNQPTGGNRQHEFSVRAQDIRGLWESEQDAARYQFWYNFPPSTEVLFPQPGQVVGSTFTILWSGVDPDGQVVEYQYALDPAVNPFSATADTQLVCQDTVPGQHEFWVRAKDNAGCWSSDYACVSFAVE